MIEFRVLGPKTGPERRAGYQTNIPPTTFHRLRGQKSCGSSQGGVAGSSGGLVCGGGGCAALVILLLIILAISNRRSSAAGVGEDSEVRILWALGSGQLWEMCPRRPQL